jgi:uncharacterized protein
MIFVDTGAWFSYFVPGDADHTRVEAWIDSHIEPLVTTDYCIDETLTLLAARGRVQRAIDAGRAFFHEKMATIHFLKETEIHRAWILFQQRAAAGWSFTDCTSKIVIDDLGIATAVALDDHFRQFGSIAVVP